jgi:hypothetical protein
MDKKVILFSVFLIFGSCNIFSSSRRLPSDYNPTACRDIGATLGFAATIAASRLLVFKSIHTAFKTHPIVSPYKRFAAKSALFLGYVAMGSMGAVMGGVGADEIEDQELTAEQQTQKYGMRLAQRVAYYL